MSWLELEQAVGAAGALQWLLVNEITSAATDRGVLADDWRLAGMVALESLVADHLHCLFNLVHEEYVEENRAEGKGPA